ncbi:MAG: lytic transglycosylase domain-containing protein [Clostridium sp.]|uniref:lytic transglycosylase domain-containing protein n=1 Tax=Clostridium sp. TaxID=1506 RepID=UPI003F3A7C5D
MKKIIILILSVLLILGLGNLGRILWKRYEFKAYPYKYIDIVSKYSKEYDLDPLFVLSVIKVESNFEPDAKSNADAMGLMQITEPTGEDIAKALNDSDFKADDLYNPEKNIEMGCYYLRNLYDEFGKWDLVIAAYNGGRGNVQKWLRNSQYSKDGKLTDIPFPETEKYVKKVNKAFSVYEKLYRNKK